MFTDRTLTPLAMVDTLIEIQHTVVALRESPANSPHAALLRARLKNLNISYNLIKSAFDAGAAHIVSPIRPQEERHSSSRDERYAPGADVRSIFARFKHAPPAALAAWESANARNALRRFLSGGTPGGTGAPD